MTVGQLKRILSNVPNQAEIQCVFRFRAYSTSFESHINGVTVNFEGKNPNKFSVVMNIAENEEEKAAMPEAQAA